MNEPWEGRDADELADEVYSMFLVIQYALGDNGWTCEEADALYGVMQLVGIEWADEFLAIHAASDDDESDRHVCVDAPPGWAFKDDIDTEETP